jgi:hypothetical protein
VPVTSVLELCASGDSTTLSAGVSCLAATDPPGLHEMRTVVRNRSASALFIICGFIGILPNAYLAAAYCTKKYCTFEEKNALTVKVGL